MRIHIIQHDNFESPGVIINWAKENNHHLSYTKFFENSGLPSIMDFEWLIIMGGPMGVYDEDKFPWLKSEKEFIKQSIENGKIVLGICLGSQLIAAVLGAKVYKNKYKEIGWHKINITSEGKDNSFFSSFPSTMEVGQWHEDTFDLPAGAVHLAESEACKNQAYIYKDHVVGLQFHLEFTEETLNGLIFNSKNELVKGKYIQTEAEIISKKGFIIQSNKILIGILNNIERRFKDKL